MNSDLQSITSRDTACDEAFRRHPHDPAAIEEYRTAKYEIAADILRLHEQAEKPDSDSELSALYKRGACAACEAVRTRIAQTVHDACRIIQPSAVPDDFRSRCVSIYDQLTACIRDCDSMYLPEHIERNPPSREFLISLQKQYDLETQQAIRAKQSHNKELNRLFGSRG